MKSVYVYIKHEIVEDIRARRITIRIRRDCNQILFTSVHPIYFLSYTQFFYTCAVSLSCVRVDTYCNVLPTKSIPALFHFHTLGIVFNHTG